MWKIQTFKVCILLELVATKFTEGPGHV